MTAFKLFLPSLTAFVLTLVTIPLTIKLAKRYGLVDNPRTRPHPAHIQDRIVPRAGGLPIFIGLVLSISFFLPTDKHLIGIFIATFLLLMMGLVDDKLRNFNPYIRLALQVLAAGIVVAAGVGIAFVSNPLGGILRLDQVIIPFHFLGPHRIIPLADIVAFFWIVWMMNMINFSKGVDGQMPGIVSVAAITIGFLSLRLFYRGDTNQLNIALLSFITAGASLAFLIANWHPARIFPGFSGSTILGFMIAVLSILSGAKVATALLVLLVPTVDFVYLVIRRILSGHSPVWADRNHLHHKLLDLGWSHQEISLFYIATCTILGVLAITLPSAPKIFTAIGVGVVALGIIIWLNLFALEKRSSGS